MKMSMSGKGLETRQRILNEALSQVASVGFEGLTIGTLAEALGLSKSGLFAHFGSREELQMATLELAAQQFQASVIDHEAPKGLPRLLATLSNWFGRYPQGGCVFLSGSAEYDDRPGKMRDALARYHLEWRKLLSYQLKQSQEVGHLDADLDADQVAFEIFAITAGAHHDLRLFGGKEPGQRTKQAIYRLLVGSGADPQRIVWPKKKRSG